MNQTPAMRRFLACIRFTFGAHVFESGVAYALPGEVVDQLVAEGRADDTEAAVTAALAGAEIECKRLRKSVRRWRPRLMGFSYDDERELRAAEKRCVVHEVALAPGSYRLSGKQREDPPAIDLTPLEARVKVREAKEKLQTLQVARQSADEELERLAEIARGSEVEPAPDIVALALEGGPAPTHFLVRGGKEQAELRARIEFLDRAIREQRARVGIEIDRASAVAAAELIGRRAAIAARIRDAADSLRRWRAEEHALALAFARLGYAPAGIDVLSNEWMPPDEDLAQLAAQCDEVIAAAGAATKSGSK